MSVIVGIDEVGRGCWAGPLVAAAVCIKQPIHGLTDSKLLSRKKRSELSKEIILCSNYGLGWVWPADIDRLGLTISISIAMEQALDQITLNYDEIIIDGNYNFLPTHPTTTTLVKADLLIPAVSAASIIAKVARDTYMAEQSSIFTGYGFERHVGYGTAAHISALKEFGVCELHRLSYKPVRALL